MPDIDTTGPITNPTTDAQGRATTGTQAPPSDEAPVTDGARAPKTVRGAIGADEQLGKMKKSATSDAAINKVYQSLTFGFGADLDGAIFGKQAEHVTRQMQKDYDHDNPLAAFGIDLAAAAVQSAAIPTVGVSGVAGAVGRLVTGGAAMGALQGAGQGGDAATRGMAATKGAAVGGVLGGAAGYAAKIAKPALEKMGAIDASKGAFEKVKMALKSEGKTMEDLQNFLKTNPDARAADFSPKVAEAVGKAGGVTNKTSQALGTATREDAEGQSGRIGGEVSQGQPLDKVKQQMIDDLGNLSKQTKSAYTASKAEIAPITPELQKTLDHPEVAPLLAKALKDYGGARKAGVADVANTPKYKAGSEIPSAVLDDLQKSIGNAAQEEGTGSIRYGTLKAAQQAIKDQQSDVTKGAQGLAARMGGDSPTAGNAYGSGVIGAQEFGHAFAFGLKKADTAAWDKIKGNPEMVQYARLGMLNGLDEYLAGNSRMTEGSLTKIADKLRTPEVEKVLGPKGANDVRKVFEKEAARQRVTADMSKGGNRQAAFHEENESRMASHAANVVGGLGHVVGTTARLLTGTGMSEKQALNIIQMAAKPGGLAKIKAGGAPKNVMDILLAGANKIAGGAAASTDIKGSR